MEASGYGRMSRLLGSMMPLRSSRAASKVGMIANPPVKNPPNVKEWARHVYDCGISDELMHDNAWQTLDFNQLSGGPVV